ncbi:hypothetical protein BJ944DRAFT_197141 [Cunninghamella echinulata]|nr:hypothetical protein BJ944DRAFT_197141 [Cunninghamella echinulata]
MNTAPSKRELQQFLKRFVPPPQQQKVIVELPPTNNSQHSNSNNNNKNNTLSIAPGLQSPKDYVMDLLAPTYHNQIALTKVQGPFAKHEWKAVGETLHKLQKLGLTSIVVTDNPSWQVDDKTASSKERIMMMVRESMALIEAIENAGGRARLIYGDVLEFNQDQQSLEVNLDFIHFALSNDQIPIVIPAVVNDSVNIHHQQQQQQQKTINANDTMIALTNKLCKSSFHQKLTPSKIVVINHEGGIPNQEHAGDTVHSLVNVQEEYDAIVNAFQNRPLWEKNYPNAIGNLTMIRDCLAQLPQSTSSAIMVPTSSLPSALIANLITDKPLYSSSLPIENTSAMKRVNQLRTTVFRHGIKIQNYTQLSDLNLDRLTSLLENSFQKKLDKDGYYQRLDSILAGAIIAGDYEGAVIMTNENKNHQHQPIYYLDKFAIAPTSQGIGLTDILWKKMCDNYPELLWRSRKDNGVNKWYFERSNGYLRLKDSNWVLFWHGKNGYRQVEKYADIAKGIPASFI